MVATNKKLVLVADFETQNFIINGTTQARTVAFGVACCYELIIKEYQLKVTKNDYKILDPDVFYFDNYGLDVLADFFNHLLTFTNKYNQVVVYFHNLKGFDGFFIVPYLIKNFKQKPLEYYNNLNDGDFVLIYANYQIHTIKFKVNNCEVLIKDTLLHFSDSLANLAKMVGMVKFDLYDYNLDLKKGRKRQTKEYLDYVNYTKQDVLILARYLQNYLITTNNDITHSISSAGFVYSWFLSENKNALKDLRLRSSWEWTIGYLSYYGGYTRASERYLNRWVDNIYYYDINSSYPAVQAEAIPCGRLYFDYASVKAAAGGDDDKIACLYRVVFKQGKVYQHLQPIIRNPSVKFSVYKRIYRDYFIKEITTPFEAVIWDVELDVIKRFYYGLRYEVINKYYMIKKRLFSGFILKLYQQRLQLKHALKLDPDNIKLKIAQYNVKIGLNSLYGKFGENIYKKQKIYVNFPLVLERLLFWNKTTLEWEVNLDIENIVSDNYYIYQVVEVNRSTSGKFEGLIIPYNQEPDKIKNIFISSYITAAARVRLYEKIEVLGDNFLYCDTDSIITKKAFKSGVNPDLLGMWKCEHENAKIYILGNKRYTLITNYNYQLMKASGVNPVNLSVDVDKIKLTKISSKKVPGGVVLNKENYQIINNQIIKKND